MEMERYFEFEGGNFVFYQFNPESPQALWSAKRVGIAYDEESLSFYRFGGMEELMKWAGSQRTHLDAEFARRLVVAPLPSDTRVQELNRLLLEPSYSPLFLTKMGLV